MKVSSWQANPSPTRVLHKQQTEIQPLSSSEKGLFTYPGAAPSGTGFRFPTHLEAKGASKETPSLHTPLASLQLNKAPQKWLLHSFIAPVFCNYHPGDTSRSPGLEANRDTIEAPQGYIYLCTLKAAA